MIRSYRELSQRSSFEERYRYLELKGIVGEVTFGYDRWLNQNFYHSRQWRHVRELVIIRDNGCDLGIPGLEIHGALYIHHMNPMTIEDFEEGNSEILDPDFLISCTLNTHNAIHYGDETKLIKPFVERRPGDTKLW